MRGARRASAAAAAGGRLQTSQAAAGAAVLPGAGSALSSPGRSRLRSGARAAAPRLGEEWKGVARVGSGLSPAARCRVPAPGASGGWTATAPRADPRSSLTQLSLD
ncbi:hypothetical protein VULLAG_LOCUS7662 [Vulpes lagopus]